MHYIQSSISIFVEHSRIILLYNNNIICLKMETQEPHHRKKSAKKRTEDSPNDQNVSKDKKSLADKIRDKKFTK